MDKSTASRTAKELVARGLSRPLGAGGDKRRKPILLTAAGRKKLEAIHETANQQVDEALRLLRPEERAVVVSGMELYAKALGRRRHRAALRIRPIRASDDPEVAALIRTVMPEFGARGPGFAINDPEVDHMSRAYRGPRAAYWVVERDGRVVGGGGFAPLVGGSKSTAELRKMYFLTEVRGLGLGAELLERSIEGARKAGFSRMYLETLENMRAARRLYEAFGFQPLDQPRGLTGHFGCDAWYEQALGAQAKTKSTVKKPASAIAPPTRRRPRAAKNARSRLSPTG